MPNINTKNYRVLLAQQFANAIANTIQVTTANAIETTANTITFAANAVSNTEATRMYVGIGRVTSWANDTPTTPTQDVQSVSYDYWRDSIGFKRVPTTGVALVVPRHDWVYGTVYTKYDDADPTLYQKTFYVLDTSGIVYRVYKCLWNGATVTNPNGVGSIASPAVYAGESASPVQSPVDGYVWQYLYSIDPLDPFLTNMWMPVYADSYVQSVALEFSGALATQVPLVITSGGAGYNSNTAYTIAISGDGANASITNTSITVAQNGSLSSVYFTNGGRNYTRVDAISISQPSATQAALRAIIPPKPNHGYDPVHELGASAVMLRTSFVESESGKLTTANQYRRIFAVQDPKLSSNTAVSANGSFYKQTYDLTLTSISGTFTPDMNVVITNTTYGVTATVVDVVADGANTVLRVTNANPHGRSFANTFIVGDTIKDSNNATTNATIAMVSTPELNPYSGSIVYVEHHSAVTRTANGEEIVKLVFNFG